MFSDVGNIYASQNPLLREAEVTDTRLNLRRQKPEFYKKKNKKDRNGEESEEIILSEQTNNEISIDVIYGFLADIAQKKPFLSVNDDGDQELPSLFDTLAENKLNRIRKRYEAARAASAYQHASHTAQNSRVHHIDTSNKSCLGLSTLSNKNLYALIKDIDDLRKKGVTTLKIRKQESFLQSLIKCVEEEKSIIKQSLNR